jgi:branched-chain amino acid transport system ATP-binding protein
MSAVVSISPDFSFSYSEGNVLFSTGGEELRLEKGKIYGLYGSNGVGKTTLLNVINTMIKPTTGCIKYQFQDKSYEFNSSSNNLDADLISNNIRRSFQVPMLIDEWGVLENIMLIKREYDEENFRHVFDNKSFLDDRAQELLSIVGISGQERADNLSYGQRRILANLQMIYSEAPLLILDEPFANLHERVIAVLQDEYKRIVEKQNETIVVVEHKRNVIEAFADKIISIKEKQLFFEDTHVES